MRDIGSLERELLRIRRANENNAKIVESLREQIQDLQKHIDTLKQLINQQVSNDN